MNPGTMKVVSRSFQHGLATGEWEEFLDRLIEDFTGLVSQEVFSRLKSW